MTQTPPEQSLAQDARDVITAMRPVRDAAAALRAAAAAADRASARGDTAAVIESGQDILQAAARFAAAYRLWLGVRPDRPRWRGAARRDPGSGAGSDSADRAST